MNKELTDMIKEAYADTMTVQEVAELYSDIKILNQLQMEDIMNIRVGWEIENAE